MSRSAGKRRAVNDGDNRSPRSHIDEDSIPIEASHYVRGYVQRALGGHDGLRNRPRGFEDAGLEDRPSHLSPAPTRTTNRMDTSVHAGNAARFSKRQASIAAYSSGIIADWTHQSRSIWFQRKAIIIISCFLAIFIVLTIGAAVFLRDRSADGADEDADDISDEAALKRMREERRMRSGTRKKQGLAGAEKKAVDPAIAGQDVRDVGSPTKKSRRRRSDKEGSSSGSSTAVSKRLVSRWIRAPGAPHGPSPTPDSGSAADDSASMRSSSSRRSRLGGPRSERLEVEYDDADQNGGETAFSDRPHQAGASPNRVASRTSSNQDRPSSSSGPSSGPSRLDASDFQAADHAATQHHQQDGMPPAYISSSTSSGSALAPPPPVDVAPGGDVHDSRQAAYQRPLAGEGGTDSKGGRLNITAPVIPARLLDAEEDGSGRPAAGEGASAHIATDDKDMLAALAAAASAPGASVASPSAPRYSSNADDADCADVEGGGLATGPSAPAADVDEDGFERMEVESGDAMGCGGSAPASGSFVGASSLMAQPSGSNAPRYEGGNVNVRDEKGKGRASSTHLQAPPLSRQGSNGVDVADSASILPQPPVPHQQAFSPFDRPYHHQSPFVPAHLSRQGSQASQSRTSGNLEGLHSDNHRQWAGVAPRPGTRTPGGAAVDESSQDASARRRAEKQREAEGELALVASAPPGGVQETTDQDVLPAYEGSSAAKPSAVASAPDVEDLSSADRDTQGSVPSHPCTGTSNDVPSAPIHNEHEATSTAASAPAIEDGDGET